MMLSSMSLVFFPLSYIKAWNISQYIHHFYLDKKKMSIFIFENVPLLIWNIIRKNDNMIYEIFHPSKCYFIIAPLCLDIHWQFCSGSRLALLWHQEPHHSRASSGLGVRSWVQDIIIYLKMYLIRIICPIHIFLSSH